MHHTICPRSTAGRSHLVKRTSQSPVKLDSTVTFAPHVRHLAVRRCFVPPAPVTDSASIIDRRRREDHSTLIRHQSDRLLQQCALWDVGCSYAPTTECPQLRGASGAEDDEVSTYCSRPRSTPLAACRGVNLFPTLWRSKVPPLPSRHLFFPSIRLLSPLLFRSLRSRPLNPARESDSRVWGEAPAVNDFGAFWGWRKAAGKHSRCTVSEKENSLSLHCYEEIFQRANYCFHSVVTLLWGSKP